MTVPKEAREDPGRGRQRHKAQRACRRGSGPDPPATFRSLAFPPRTEAVTGGSHRSVTMGARRGPSAPFGQPSREQEEEG